MRSTPANVTCPNPRADRTTSGGSVGRCPACASIAPVTSTSRGIDMAAAAPRPGIGSAGSANCSSGAVSVRRTTSATRPGANDANGSPSANNSAAFSPPHRKTSRPPSSIQFTSAANRCASAASCRHSSIVACRNYEHVDRIVAEPFAWANRRCFSLRQVRRADSPAVASRSANACRSPI